MPTVRPRTTLYLWEFLLQLLDGKDSCPAISWVNRDKGEFILKDQAEIAKLWGKVKGRPQMDKIKLGRAMRYYYKKKLLAKVPRRKAVYRFVQFDILMEKGHETEMTQDQLPEIDLNDDDVLELIGDEKIQDIAPSDLDVEDGLLESFLTEKHASFEDPRYRNLIPMESTSNTQNRVTNNDDTLDRYTSSNGYYYLNDINKNIIDINTFDKDLLNEMVNPTSLIRQVNPF